MMNKGIKALESIQQKLNTKKNISINKEIEIIQKEMYKLEILLKHFYISDINVEGKDLQNPDYHLVKLISKDNDSEMTINLPENEFRIIFGCSYKEIFK